MSGAEWADPGEKCPGRFWHPVRYCLRSTINTLFIANHTLIMSPEASR